MTKPGDTLRIPTQPPLDSQVRVEGGRHARLVFRRVTADSWLARHDGTNLIEDWQSLLTSARSAGVTLLRIGQGQDT